MKSAAKWIYKKITYNDMYAKSITFSFKGKSKLRTFWGGIISSAIALALLVNFCSSLYILVNRKDTKTSTKTVFQNNFNSERKKYLGKNDFRMGLVYASFPSGIIGDNLLSDKSYFNVTFYNTEYHRTTEGSERIPILVPSGYCNDSFKEYVEPELFERMSLDKHICPSNDDYYMVGDYNSKLFRDLEIYITPCNENNNEGVVWQPKEEIDRAIYNGYINIAITRSYFDFNDYENPVKTFLSESESFFMVEGITTWAGYYIQENTALRSDNLFYNEPFQESIFYDITTKNIKTVNKLVTNGAVLFITVGPYAETVHYERTVYSLLDLFGYLGGFYDFMLFIGFWFVQGFQDKIFHNAIFSNLYQVKSNDENDNVDVDESSMSVMEETKSNNYQICNTFTNRTLGMRKV